MFWPNTTKRSMYFFSRAFIQSLFSYEGIISIAVKNGYSTWSCSLFRFRLLLVPAVLPSRSPDARVFSFLPWLTLDSHSIRPSRSVVTARRLYKFYIIFMRHKVVEKPTEEKRERVRARAEVRQRGSFSVQITPLGFLSSPASRHSSHVAGRSGSHPLVLARRREIRRAGQADNVEGMLRHVRGSGL